MEVLKRLYNNLNLDSDIDDYEQIHLAIEKDIVFKGTNLWILMFAIIMASVGLNMNSTAVVIGAMLISPLMGPINGMGYSIATFNFPLFRKSMKNFGFAVGAGLFASTAYFAISPVSTAHSELLARTSPTIYDVLIAFFGGLAGIITISSKLKGNVIPGVAIATALMPPLCTAGYGLATWQITYFLGAIYLFTINSVFIALSSVAVSQFLKFPITTIVDPEQKKRVNQWLSAVIFITVIPSIYFGYLLVQKERFHDNATRFINSVSALEGDFLMKHEIFPSTKSVSLVYVGGKMSEKKRQIIEERAKDFSIDMENVEIKHGFSVDDIINKNNESENLKIEINRLAMLVRDKEEEIRNLQSKPLIGKQLLAELNTLYPEIHSCTYSESVFHIENSDSIENVAIIIIKSEPKSLAAEEKERIRKWLKERNSKINVEVYFRE